MARAYRVWVERDKKSGAITGCAAYPLTAAGESVGRKQGWQQWIAPSSEHPVFGPWGVLLRLMNVDRVYPPPRNHDFVIDREFSRWNRRMREELPDADWDAWKSFAEDVQAPYLLTEQQGHPLLWYPGSDGEWYGFLFNFGLIPGKWHWWVPGTERVELLPGGGYRIVFGERHEERAAGATMRELFASLPACLLDVDPKKRLTLKEALDEVLRRHSAEERDRCRFFVYRPMDRAGDPSEPLGARTLGALGDWIATLAWTWLSPYVMLWEPSLRSEWAGEIADDPHCRKPETAKRLAQMTPRERFARTLALEGGDPLAPLLQDLEPQAGFEPDVAPRIMPSLLEKADDSFFVDRKGRVYPERKKQTQEARKILAASARFREEFRTTNVFAVAAKQLEWAVEAGLTLLTCVHPGCGMAFVVGPDRGPGRLPRSCPEHRDVASRQRRSRQRKREGK